MSLVTGDKSDSDRKGREPDFVVKGDNSNLISCLSALGFAATGRSGPRGILLLSAYL